MKITKLDVAMLVALAVLLVALPFAVRAEQVCQSVYDPLNARWNLVCVERASPLGPAPVCRMVYDALNGVWVQVCQ